MYVDKYTMDVSNDDKTYEFYGTGPKGRIKKVVSYTRIKEGNPNMFNLGFGDWDEARQRVNDKVVTDNKDWRKVLATVVYTVFDFTKYHQDALILAKGVTPSRNRLYQIGISVLWPEISQFFNVLGLTEEAWESFQSGKNYKSFAVTKRENIVDL